MEKPLFTPCACSGTAAFVHEACLVTTMANEGRRSSSLNSCQNCGRTYKFDYVYPSAEIFRSFRRTNIIICICSTIVNVILTLVIWTLPLFFPDWPIKVKISWYVLCVSSMIRYSVLCNKIGRRDEEPNDTSSLIGSQLKSSPLIPFLLAKVILDIVMVVFLVGPSLEKFQAKEMWHGVWDTLAGIVLFVIPVLPYLISTVYVHDVGVIKVLLQEVEKYKNPFPHLEGKLQLYNYDATTNTFFPLPSTVKSHAVFRDCYQQTQANQDIFKNSTCNRDICPFFQRREGPYPDRSMNEYIMVTE